MSNGHIFIIAYYGVFTMSCILHKDFGLLKKVPVNAGNDESIYIHVSRFWLE